jgi:hypothetical protein
MRDFARELITDVAGGDASYDVDAEDEDSVTNHDFLVDLVDTDTGAHRSLRDFQGVAPGRYLLRRYLLSRHV